MPSSGPCRPGKMPRVPVSDPGAPATSVPASLAGALRRCLALGLVLLAVAGLGAEEPAVASPTPTPTPADAAGWAAVPAASATPAPQDLPQPTAAGSTGSTGQKVSGTKDNTKLVLGICRLATEGLPAGLEYLAQSIPQAWADQLNRPLYRKPDVEAAVRARWRSFDTELVAAERRLSDAIDKRDLAWLKGSLTGANQRSLESQIVKARGELAALEATRAGLRAKVEASLPQWQTLDLGNLLTKGLLEPVNAATGPAARAKASGVDLLLWGRLFSVRDYLFLEFHVHDVANGTDILDQTVSLDDQDYAVAGAEVLERIMPGLLGYEPAALTGLPEDPGARLRLRSATGLDYGSSIGRTTWSFLLPGSYQLSSDSDAAFPVLKTLVLAAGDRVEVPLVRVPKQSRLVRLESDPPGAAVYDGVLFCGHTPLDLDLGRTGGLLVFRLAGFEDLTVPVMDLGLGPASLAGAGDAGPGTAVAAGTVGDSGTAEAEPPVEGMLPGAAGDAGTGVVQPPAALAGLPVYQARLSPALFDWKQEVSHRRRAFYDALGWFALSLGPAIFFGGLADNISPLATDLADEKELYSYLSLGGVVLSAIMFGDAGFKLAEYLGVVDAADGRQDVQEEKEFQ